jgi:uncharacterized LabA/DUF88 family protein
MLAIGGRRFWNNDRQKQALLYAALSLPCIDSKMKKIALFVDVQNIYYTTRQAYGRQFNYRELWQRISSEGEIVLANAYAIDRHDQKQVQFQSVLKKIGFTIKLKPYIQRSDGTSKGDWDVGITIDIMQAAKDVDCVVLLSGDGDFDLLLLEIRRNFDVSAEVYGVPTLTANSLVNAANIFNPIKTDLLL